MNLASLPRARQASEQKYLPCSSQCSELSAQGANTEVTYSQEHFLCNEQDRDCREGRGAVGGAGEHPVCVPSTSTV